MRTATKACLAAINILSFGIGYLFCGFTEVLDAQSWAVPLGLFATLVLNVWATMCITQGEVDYQETLPYIRRRK